MRQIAVALTLALASLAAVPADAALEYEYIQTIRSSGEEARPSDLTAKAVIDGDRARIDFISGNTYPPGTYMVTTDGMKRLTFVDPTNKSYTEVNTSSIVSSIATSNIKITNLRSNVTRLDDKQNVAGVPTDHYRLSLQYEITVTFRDMALRQSVSTVIDQWTTVQFGDVSMTLNQNSLLTGNPEVDSIIQLETTKIKGFPLKQRIQTTTMNLAKPVSGSKLQLPASQTKTRELTVTSIRQVPAEIGKFAIPAGFQRLDTTQVPTKAPMQVLQMEGSAE